MRSILLLALALATPAGADIFDDARALGRGINLGNALDAPNEGEWGFVLEAAYFKEVADAGFDSVRIPIRWSAHAGEKAPYAIDAKFFQRVDWALAQSQANGLAAVINVHHYAELNSDLAGNRERYLALWRQIAERYRDQPRTVVFELLNEPHDSDGGQLGAAAWNALLPAALAVVRESNPDRPVIVGPSPWNGWAGLKDLQLPDDENLIATFHYYEPFEFTHQGAEWVAGAAEWKGATWSGTPNQRRSIDEAFDAVAAWSKANRRPVYVGEFGAYSKTPLEDRARWTSYVRQAAERRGFAWAYWEFGSGFGAYDPQQQAWIKPLRAALVPSE